MNQSRSTLSRLLACLMACALFASYSNADEPKSSTDPGGRPNGSASSTDPSGRPNGSASSTAPNIIVFFLDDSGYGDYAHNGNPTIRTPNISKLAQDGMNFTQFYVTSPACSASRYSLLTGRYPGRSGLGSWTVEPRAQAAPSPQRNHPR